ncbi:hypothetical protein BGW36DRAFT_403162 [Talaromyces proteolyticus]|uniref:Uncharacterized protein n=1 Tax=Talaromyces proteolyticus TaxID=1131652 RepID=A0AAD4L460_9EURO|nr:uncharacterized protein BGW36DRAFT_403162 [Talaromyces proteolyticus]KAH8705622.1 hypothetical protein BGW36DRAFT_403162 [Talaromyces proteolyticus]
MSTQTPGKGFPSYRRKHSWLMNYDRGYNYLAQLPDDNSSSSKEMMFGGGFAQGKNDGIEDPRIITVADLSLYIDIHLCDALGAIYGNRNCTWGRVDGQVIKDFVDRYYGVQL